MNTTQKVKLDYVWLDGYETKNIRNKTKYMSLDILEVDTDGRPSMKSPEKVLSLLPDWSFDGSSTKQAVGNNSDLVLRPVRVVRNPIEQFKINAFIVLCEVLNPDGSPHESNTRHDLIRSISETNQKEMMFGIEQEYTFINREGSPLGWPDNPEEQGKYYCGVGGDVIRGREIADNHAMACLSADLLFEGTNAEVMMSQWEYQIGAGNAVLVSDHLWISRYLLQLLSERYSVCVSYDPKPVEGDWNGSGAHVNFSTKYMRQDSNMEYLSVLCEGMEKHHDESISKYGEGNERRLTGDHETAHIDEYSFGISDRGASIRIPLSTVVKKGRGHLEDRRPAANIDPYECLESIVRTVSKVHQESLVST
tara:strand:+ start:6015 stop:7109 length:1095 start_codon:yes stop_codon:yes gene_type:complete